MMILIDINILTIIFIADSYKLQMTMTTNDHE